MAHKNTAPLIVHLTRELVLRSLEGSSKDVTTAKCMKSCSEILVGWTKFFGIFCCSQICPTISFLPHIHLDHSPLFIPLLFVPLSTLYPSVHLSVHLYVHLSVHLAVHLAVHLSV